MKNKKIKIKRKKRKKKKEKEKKKEKKREKNKGRSVCVCVYVCVCVCMCGGAVAWWLGCRIWNHKVPSSSPSQEQKKKAACVVSLDKALSSHCLSPPSCKNGYLTSVGEAKDRWVARIPSSSGCGPGGTSGAHAISHCAIQRLLVHTGPVSGGFVSAGPKILRSAQETWLL